MNRKFCEGRQIYHIKNLKIGKIITFKGKKVEWVLWSKKYKVGANCKGCKGVLLSEEGYIVPYDSVDIDAMKDSKK